MNIIEKKKRQMGQGGFTLIELLVVIAILAVLAGLAVIGIGAMRDNAKTTACKADKDTAETAGQAWIISDGNTATDLSLGALTSSGLLKKNGKVTSVTADAAGNVYVLATGC